MQVGDTITIVGGANAGLWHSPGELICIAPYCLFVQYRHKERDETRTDWFDNVNGKRRGDGEQDGVRIEPFFDKENTP